MVLRRIPIYFLSTIVYDLKPKLAPSRDESKGFGENVSQRQAAWGNAAAHDTTLLETQPRQILPSRKIVQQYVKV